MFLDLILSLPLHNPHLYKDQCQEVVSVCFHKGLRGHATPASHGKVSKPLHEVLDGLSFLLLGEEERVHVHIDFFFEEATEEKSFWFVSACDRPLGQLFDPIEDNPILFYFLVFLYDLMLISVFHALGSRLRNAREHMVDVTMIL